MDRKIDIVPLTIEHLKEMELKLPKLDREIIEGLGLGVDRTLEASYERSLYSKAAIMDKKLIAIWGVMKGHEPEIGYPWLLMSDFVSNFPFKVAFIYRKELDKMLDLFPVLIDFVNVKSVKSIRLMSIMGFSMGELVTFGVNNDLFIKAEKRKIWV